jgi:hypothetical protein
VTGRRAPNNSPEVSDQDLADLVPNARRVHPSELVVGDALFDNTGSLHPVAEITTFQDNKLVSALQDNAHRVWFFDDEPITAILQRPDRPSLTCYARVLDISDEEGWAGGDPAVIDTEQESMTWEPDDGNPVTWAVQALQGWGTLQPSSSLPYDQRTWYSTTWTDWQRAGTTVDVSAHLAGFTRAEAEQIGLRVTAPPASPRPAAVTRLADRSAHRTPMSTGRTRHSANDHGLSR